MKREKLESYIGKKVKVTLYNHYEYIGFLGKGNCYFETAKDYFLKEANLSFKLSHVKKVELHKSSAR